MKAFVFETYGTPDVLELKEIERPVPGDNEVLIKVHSVSINDWDWQLLHGIPFGNRMANGMLKPKKLKILGCDVAGQIETIGSNVKQFQPGDLVFGDLCRSGFGGFAEYVCAHKTAIALKPSGMTFDEAAAIPQAAMLALQGLRWGGQIKPGQKLLINGAGGGVGSFGVQLANLFGVDDVTGVDHTEKLDMLRSIGFTHVIDYTKDDFTRNGKAYDYILDTKTDRSVTDYQRALTPRGRYVTVGGSTGNLLQLFLLGPLLSRVRNKKMGVVILKPNRDIAYINELFISGGLHPIIDGPYNFNELPAALKYFGAGKHRGKVVVNLEQNKATQQPLPQAAGNPRRNEVTGEMNR